MRIRSLPADEAQPHHPPCCAACGAELEGEPERGEPVCVQVTELPKRVLRVAEHRLHAVCCPRCGHTIRAQAPAGVAGHAFGPRLSALVALLAGQCHLPRRLTQRVLAPLGGPAAPSLRSVEALLQESRHALAGPHRQIRQEIRLTSDEPLHLGRPFRRRGKSGASTAPRYFRKGGPASHSAAPYWCDEFHPTRRRVSQIGCHSGCITVHLRERTSAPVPDWSENW